jgi:glyoxylase-like metal-dependent hydrolase (beta-lactamase superfamily II)/rhodanese-related sulfurtransferase
VSATVPAPAEWPDVRVLQLGTPDLGDSSYVVASRGEVAVLDPQRDLDRLEEVLGEVGGHVVAVLETHVHNDYVSGGPALAAASGAEYIVPAGAGCDLAHRPIEDGGETRVGEVVLRALRTPGHTPHHTSYELLVGGRVAAIFTGGSVLVGACGRSDLLGPDLADELTRLQYRSARRIGERPNATVLGPTHGTGSFCSSSGTGGETWTTVGREKLVNPVYLAAGEDAFVAHHLADRLDFPAYYREMAPINRRGAAAWRSAPPATLTADDLAALQDRGVVLVDVRNRRSFAEAHVPGSVNVELDESLATYLGWVFPFGTRFALIAAAGQEAEIAYRRCARIGIEGIEGVAEDPFAEWLASGRPLRRYPVTDVEGLRRAVDDHEGLALDVRQRLEWLDGHVPGSLNVHVTELAGRIGELPRDRSVYVHCLSGSRAAIAASLLDASGLDVVLVADGFAEWARRRHTVEWGDRAAAASRGGAR